jgi:hypothetical protein
LLERDMIAVRVADELRLVVIASRAYIEGHGRPKTPHDLLSVNQLPPDQKHEGRANGRSIGCSCQFSDSMLTNLPRCTMSLGAETAQQLYHVVAMFWRWITDTEDPVKQIGVRAIEQLLKSPELTAVQGLEGVLGERAENEVAFLRPAMPAAEQQPPAPDVSVMRPQRIRNDMCHHIHSSFSVANLRRCQCCMRMLIGAGAGISMF